MKFLLLALCPALATAVLAQTGTPARSEAGSPPRKTAAPAAPNKLLDGNSKHEGPITTEIYSNEAFFDSNKSMGIFTGNVKVLDPRFNLQSDKLTVFMQRGEDQGLQKAIAEGHVGLVRDRPNEKGGPPERAIGRAEHAVYTANDGNVELTGTPRVQQGMNMHIATSADTVMVINQNGQLTTRGPSRTEIRQEPKPEEGASPGPSPSPKNR